MSNKARWNNCLNNPFYNKRMNIKMNEHTLKGEWNQIKGSVKQKWADLTDDDLLHVEGSRDKLVGKVQERYGKTHEQAERDVDDFSRRLPSEFR